MNPENAIEVRNVSKYFKVYYDKGRMLRERVVSFYRNKYERREVLRGISFDIKKGEAVGLIGKNGCGKSTTLKLLTKILRPNGGTIEISGRVCSLIELGAGFHPDMSGRENIYINASIFGIKAKEVDQRLPDIIRFSELEEYIDNPVRTYSSGMYMRLAFSVAINVDADILLIDEILAVGDQAFQTKCFNKLAELKKHGTTIVLVSHALGQVEQICDRAIWIDKGVIKKAGPSSEICNEYLEATEIARLERVKLEQSLREKENRQEEIERERKKKEEAERKNASCREVTSQCGANARREGNGKMHFSRIQLLDKLGKECQLYQTGDSFRIVMEYESCVLGEDAEISLEIVRNDGICCQGSIRRFCSESGGKFEFYIQKLVLLQGDYYLSVKLCNESGELYDVMSFLIEFHVGNAKPGIWGITSMDPKWVLNCETLKYKAGKYE